jgi:hypothetical protein
VIIDDQDLLGSAACTEEDTGPDACGLGSTAITTKPSSEVFEKLKRPPAALTRSLMPTRP